MIRLNDIDGSTFIGIPRESGDDPSRIAIIGQDQEYSPRERG